MWGARAGELQTVGLGNVLKNLASQLVFMKLSKLLNEGLFRCVSIDIITANPFLITNGLKQKIV